MNFLTNPYNEISTFKPVDVMVYDAGTKKICMCRLDWIFSTCGIED